jgi:hypothetical protein
VLLVVSSFQPPATCLQVVQETLRLYPAGAVAMREAVEDCHVADLYLPKGTPVRFSPTLTGAAPSASWAYDFNTWQLVYSKFVLFVELTDEKRTGWLVIKKQDFLKTLLQEGIKKAMVCHRC